jgi:2-amino-4-hydroxy-6-hydroxymethyldihydropteridine diphosphokinase
MVKVFLSTGSNLGDRMISLVRAAKLIDKLIGKVIEYSPVVESEPWGFESDTNFYNQVLVVETELAPREMLIKLLEIEKMLGRVRESASYSSRSIDIDILFYGNLQIDGDNLCIPHPRLHLRKFVLQPLAIIAPDFIHPVLKNSVTELLYQVDDQSELKIIADKKQFLNQLNSVNLS